MKLLQQVPASHFTSCFSSRVSDSECLGTVGEGVTYVFDVPARGRVGAGDRSLRTGQPPAVWGPHGLGLVTLPFLGTVALGGFHFLMILRPLVPACPSLVLGREEFLENSSESPCRGAFFLKVPRTCVPSGGTQWGRHCLEGLCLGKPTKTLNVNLMSRLQGNPRGGVRVRLINT